MHPAGLPQQLHSSPAPARRDLPREALGERGLARAVEALDGDQRAPHHRLTVSPQRVAQPAEGDEPGPSSSVTMGRVSPPPAQALPGIDAHPHARAVLIPALPDESSGRAPSHAYLFHGPPGVGKRTVARAFAAALLAEGSPAPEAARARVSRGAHPDLTWVTPSGAGEMLVGDIDRAVIAAAAHTPFESLRRVFVLEDAHTMNDQAANRLLKTLEEPPPFVHILLLAPSPREVLPTIASRCQHVRFDHLPSARIEERLAADTGSPRAPLSGT